MPPRRYNVDIEIDREKQTAEIQHNGERLATIEFHKVSPRLLCRDHLVEIVKLMLKLDGFNEEMANIEVYGDE